MTEFQTAGIADQGREKTGEAQERLQEGAEKARSSLTDQIDQRTGQASEQVRATADALRGAADQLREQGQETPARVADRAAEQGTRLADYLHDTSGNRLLHDAEDLGRTRPALVVGAGLVAGFALARLLKATSEQRYRGGRLPEGSTPGAGSAATTGALPAAQPLRTPPVPAGPAGTTAPANVPASVGAGAGTAADAQGA